MKLLQIKKKDIIQLEICVGNKKEGPKSKVNDEVEEAEAGPKHR